MPVNWLIRYRAGQQEGLLIVLHSPVLMLLLVSWLSLVSLVIYLFNSSNRTNADIIVVSFLAQHRNRFCSKDIEI